jgi:hypothetical protein
MLLLRGRHGASVGDLNVATWLEDGPGRRQPMRATTNANSAPTRTRCRCRTDPEASGEPRCAYGVHEDHLGLQVFDVRATTRLGLELANMAGESQTASLSVRGGHE